LRRGLLDYVAMDVKAPLNKEEYGRVIGLNNVEKTIANVRESIELCFRSSTPMEIRTTIVPTLIDDEKSIREIAGIVQDHGIYVLQEFLPFEDVLDERLRKVKPPSRGLLIMLAKSALEKGVKKVYIRTRGNGMERVFLAE
jgi:pyruvate formate lyase activating enzyme